MDNSWMRFVEPKRTFAHLMIPALALASLLQSSQRIFLGLFVALFTSETARLRSEKYNRFATTIIGPFMRDAEKTQMVATTGLLLGLTVANTTLPFRMFWLAVATVTLADLAAKILGKAFGTIKFRTKEPKTLVGFCAAWAMSSILFSLCGFGPMRVVTDSLIVACMETLGRHKPFFLDDNALILVALAIIWM